jgi:hypothetical protein
MPLQVKFGGGKGFGQSIPLVKGRALKKSFGIKG